MAALCCLASLAGPAHATGRSEEIRYEGLGAGEVSTSYSALFPTAFGNVTINSGYATAGGTVCTVGRACLTPRGEAFVDLDLNDVTGRRVGAVYEFWRWNRYCQGSRCDDRWETIVGYSGQFCDQVRSVPVPAGAELLLVRFGAVFNGALGCWPQVSVATSGFVHAEWHN